MTAQVSFLDGTLSLIHIPLDLYTSLLQPILKVVLPPSQDPTQSLQANLTSNSHKHGFLNISVTPIECSIVCNSAWAQSVFEPAIKRLPREQAKSVAISKDTYAALSVYGAGVDAGSRVADLTSPLALAGIPIFFITTYYSDFILVPIKDRQVVVKTLLGRGFVFSEDDQSQLISAQPSPTATSHNHHGFGIFGGYNGPPADNPPSSPAHNELSELQERTFDLLKRRHVTPHVEPGLTLVQCTGIRGAGINHASSLSHRSRGFGANGDSRRGSKTTPSWVDTIDTKLYTSVVAALVAQPHFLSVTLADEDPPSLLLDRELLGLFGDSVVGPTEGALVPIFLDLADLPFEATGIVSGVAGRLVREMGMGNGMAVGMGAVGGDGVGELSYLSTARAGAVILSREQAEMALRVLKPLLGREEPGEA
ncbi:ACT domain-containing protein [Chaetomium strumarium]|uniref:ACT domain-containing protein n=1 Tax=Chaetomium strumarium TaxID=1170767 RepID=A0AAJ0GZP8_9PEZI|nr:ACT domain-containing protein [Chaetomium strumarium]